MKRSEAINLRKHIEDAVQSLPDAAALEAVVLHHVWKAGVYYSAGYKAQHRGMLWRCLQTHTSQSGWDPNNAPSLWAKVLIPDENVVPEWEQPDSTNPYMQGDKVTHNGKAWVSTIDNNVWEPGTVEYWKEV